MAVDDTVVIGQTHAGDAAESVLVGHLRAVEALRAGAPSIGELHPETWNVAGGSSPALSVSRSAPSSCREVRERRGQRCASAQQVHSRRSGDVPRLRRW
jgi:hypothetical protein